MNGPPLPPPERPADGHPLRVTGLTLLFHADMTRIGERVPLSSLEAGEPAKVARREPRFQTLDGVATHGLDDPYMSRRPVTLTRRRAGLAIEAAAGLAVRVDRRPLRSRRVVHDEDIDAGVLIELSDRVVLLLHRFRVPAPDAPSLGMVGASDAMSRTRAAVLAAASLDGPVLIRGEPGSGKELAARAIHGASERRSGPFITINLASLPPEEALSDLFGAGVDQAGLAQRAEGGTLYLDEITAASPLVQDAVRRLLETGQITPTGGVSHPLDARVIASSDADLDDAVASGNFDPRLRVRLAATEITIPPLRSRRDDIARLVAHFYAGDLAAFGDAPAPGGAPAEEPRLYFPASLMARLVMAPWPGNVRQLRNVVRQLVLSSRGEPRIVINAAVERALGPSGPPDVSLDTVELPETPLHGIPVEPHTPGLHGLLTDQELVEALRAHRWQLGPTASALGLTRPALQVLMEACSDVRKPHDLTFDMVVDALMAARGDLDAAAEALQISPDGLRIRLVELGLT